MSLASLQDSVLLLKCFLLTAIALITIDIYIHHDDDDGDDSKSLVMDSLTSQTQILESPKHSLPKRKFSFFALHLCP